MISVGTNIRSSADALKKCPIKHLYDAVRNPRPEVASLINQLRIVLQINPAGYSELKRQLPYFVCAAFNPPFRKTENFAYTEYFVVDIDHICEKGLSIQSLRNTLSADGRVVMCFLSPGGDGLKVLFHLSERCYDASLYKVFYKLFLDEFSNRYGLQQVVDGKTCDVSRACFISVDPLAFYNPGAESVDMKNYIDAEADVNEAFHLKRMVDIELKESEKELASHTPTDPDKDAMELIRQTLRPASKFMPKKDVFVPEILESIMSDLRLYISERGIDMNDPVSIQYGKKLHFRIGRREAEINLFYGKKGFSVVQSPRTGTDKEMNQLMSEVIEAFLSDYYNS